jgi:eukaryotic-like serine/threonine-protein kinase
MTLYAYRAAEKAREAETKRFGQVRSLASYMLFDLNERLRVVPGNTQTRANLAAEAQRYLSGLAASPSADAALRIETANGLIELARVQGSPLEPNLAFIPDAIRNLKLAQKMLIDLGPAAQARPEVAAALARAITYEGLMELQANIDAVASARLLKSAGVTLAAVPMSVRDDGWHQAQRLHRRARLEFADLEERVPDLIAGAKALETDIANWSPARQRSPDAAFDRALSAYYTGIAGYVSEKGDFGTASFVKADRLFVSVLATKPGSPAILYMMGWNQFLGSSAAASAGQKALSSELAIKANAIATRLLALDEKDDASIVLARVAAEAMAQDLANRGLYSEAIAAQQDVIAREKARLIRDGGGYGINLAYSEMILGTIARSAGDRALACSNWGSAEYRYSRVEKMEKILAFQTALLIGLRQNVAGCKAGTSLNALKALR